MPVYSTGTPVNTHSATGSVTGTWGSGQSRKAGHLLVAVVTCAATTSVTATATTSGWTNWLEVPNTTTANVRAALWTKVAVGSDTAPTFTSTETGTAGGMDCMLFELSGADVISASPIDTSGTYASGATAGTLTMTATTSAVLAGNAEFCISCFAQERAAASLTFTDTGTGKFSRILNGNGVSTVLQTYVGVVNPYPGGVTINDAGSFSTNTTAFGAGFVVAFKAATPTTAVNWAFANNSAGTVSSGGTTAPASGTSEAWTVNVATAFPVASASAIPPTQFTVVDPLLPAEKILVTAAPGATGSAQSWTVTRGTEGTTPVVHASGFTIVLVTTAGYLTAASKELSAVAYVDCDYTGVNDASSAFNTALASLPLNSNGRPVGKIVFGPGNVKFTITPDNPGPCVYIEGAGKWATFINSYVTGGDCFRVFDPTALSLNDATINGGGIAHLTITGTNAGAGSTGLHVGDVFNYHVDEVVILNFQGTGSKGAWFDNEWFYSEMLNGDLFVSGCTQCVVFDNPASGASTSGSSFARLNMVIRIEQGLDGTGQVWGDGVVLQNGALITDGDVTILGNFALSAASTSAAVLRLTGAVPAGHLSPGRVTQIKNSRLHIGVECDTNGANTFAPMTIFSDGTANITQCYGQLSFGSGDATFTASNLGSLLNKCLFEVSGDNNLGAQFQVFDTEQFQVITSAYTLTSSASAQKLLNATANGALTVPSGVSYFFECEFDLTNLSSTSGTFSFGLGGTATYTSVKYWATAQKSAAVATLATWSSAVISTNAATALVAASVTTTGAAYLKGIIRVNAGGTIIPQITLSVANAAVVGANSFFRLTPIGSNSVASAGNWS